MLELLFAVFAFLFSLLVLSFSASYLITSLSRFAKAFAISGFVVGALILAMANSLPEFMTALISSMKGVVDLGAGTAIGSPIANLCLVIGILILICPIKIRDETQLKAFSFLLVPIILFFLLGADGLISRLDAGIFLIVFIVYQLFLFKKGVFLGRPVPFKRVALSYIIVPIAISALIISAFLLVDTGGYLSVSLGIPAAVVGLIFIAIGTSLPDLAAGVHAALKKRVELGFGDVVGANVLDFLFIFGVIGLIKPLSFTFAYFKIPLTICFVATAFFIAYTFLRRRADRTLGLILLTIYAVYLGITWFGV